MDTNQENTEVKLGAEPTEAQKELALAQQKEKTECWEALNSTLEKYGYRYDVTFTVTISSTNGIRGAGFIVDLQKKPRE